MPDSCLIYKIGKKLKYLREEGLKSSKQNACHVWLSHKLHKATNLYLKRLSRKRGYRVTLSEFIRAILKETVREEYLELWEKSIDSDQDF